MEITGIKIHPVEGEEKLKAFVSIIIAGCFVVRYIRIIQGKKGLFVAMPSKKARDGSYKYIAHPVDQKTRQALEKKVLDAYLPTVRK